MQIRYTRYVLFLMLLSAVMVLHAFRNAPPAEGAWVRINLLGYQPDGPKTAVWCSSKDQILASFYITDVATGQVVFKGNTGPAFGAYGPFAQSYRLIFHSFAGRAVIRSGQAMGCRRSSLLATRCTKGQRIFACAICGSKEVVSILF